ncbi:DUF3885 domain-containing protein [Massilia sp. DJPM01]|uniref:DUF3885 domain-containing protein n=1 Tax=Massilia sp. DJPM01 TaxID=3024404 RepID=UPI00259DAA05|nr:DUF3885 domain-containing protein [Massilia sp. DJPM01]MDM5179910.1 DUF3885 domain-containing protein [Massilia sp. DJPM01]
MKLREQIEQLVDGKPYRHALFYNFPGGLRLRMSEGGDYFGRVLTALGKATAVCEDVFAGADTMVVHLQRYATPKRFDLRFALKQLDLAGITIPRARDIWAELVPRDEPDDDDNWWLHLVFELPRSQLQNLLWCAFACDVRELRPNPHCLVYLINPELGLIVHPYDDRGMDVIGKNGSALKHLYTVHQTLLLEYDLDAMHQTFAAGAAGPAH